ncbi:uncharacterized protein ColSpa_12573 [Colletotrichum spaethianum]|uniref:Uncharacterized protein n=1 Tax=Colletotrichum spaethianum TaxID=700344 RepID=A0AA37PHT2_9PEZI|nr:uncharacterized protein ColSpa_12573 [Colletotrichum spaethianum]GKT52392.1 hypothetical protein ColSpa_12573 [Colletotrichum spaethianum]
MFTGNHPQASGHRLLKNLIKPVEPNLSVSPHGRGGYYIVCLASRGNTFAPTVTGLLLDEDRFLETT